MQSPIEPFNADGCGSNDCGWCCGRISDRKTNTIYVEFMPSTWGWRQGAWSCTGCAFVFEWFQRPIEKRGGACVGTAGAQSETIFSSDPQLISKTRGAATSNFPVPTPHWSTSKGHLTLVCHDTKQGRLDETSDKERSSGHCQPLFYDCTVCDVSRLVQQIPAGINTTECFARRVIYICSVPCYESLTNNTTVPKSTL